MNNYKFVLVVFFIILICMVGGRTFLLKNKSFQDDIIYIKNQNKGSVQFGDLNITFKNVSSVEQKYIYSLFDKINPLYLLYNNNFLFTSDKLFSNETELGGYNMDNGLKIVISVDDLVYLKEVLCHELLHSYFNMNNDLEEQLVDDLAKKEVCYL